MGEASSKRETVPLPRRKPSGRGSGLPLLVRVLRTGKDIPFPGHQSALEIGTDPRNQVVLDDRYVSAFHCALERRQGVLVLCDRRSRNGTWINGTRVYESDVEPGARILLGATEITVLAREDRETGNGTPGEPLIIGEDPQLLAAISLAKRAASSSANVLILGESGSGKELVARLIHDRSHRAQGPFVPVNCGAIPRELVESELFGHEKGAFTGAAERRLGVFEQAHGGTLFLDEVGELALHQQPSLLRVLETGRVKPVGSSVERTVDVRVVAATHRNLLGGVERWKSGSTSYSWGGGPDHPGFREDLYHRLATVGISLPPLRERTGDLPLLVAKFLEEMEPTHGPRHVSPETMSLISTYSWPGNIRELRNAVRRAVILGDGDLRAPDMLPTWSEQGRKRPTIVLKEDGPGYLAKQLHLDPRALTFDEMSRELIERALSTHGSQRKAAAALRIPKSTFNDLARRYGLVGRKGGDG
ncbi:MAG: sigma 54-dependent Fis family transcriptional regulator [Deltaproteobacteria bacterium]|nr:sigma 54-dependent Fis family transcriptional regulator [Deltaproteobacteria bacterium]